MSLLSKFTVVICYYVKIFGWVILAALVAVPLVIIYGVFWLIDLQKRVHELCIQKEHHLDLLQEAKQLLIHKDEKLASLAALENNRDHVRKAVALLTKDCADKEIQITELQEKMSTMKAKHAEEVEDLKEDISDLCNEIEVYGKEFETIGLKAPTWSTKASRPEVCTNEAIGKVVILPDHKTDGDDSQNSSENGWEMF